MVESRRLIKAFSEKILSSNFIFLIFNSKERKFSARALLPGLEVGDEVDVKALFPATEETRFPSGADFLIKK